MCRDTFFGRFSSIVWVSTPSFSHSHTDIYKNYSTHTHRVTPSTHLSTDRYAQAPAHTLHINIRTSACTCSVIRTHTRTHITNTHFHIHTRTYTHCLQAQPRHNSSPQIKGSGVALTGTLKPGHADDTS